MNHRISYQKMGKLTAAFILLLPIIFYGWRASLRPSVTSQEKELFLGINYQKKVYSTPRPFIVHIVEVDLNTTGIQPFVTPPQTITDTKNTNALTTSEFIKKFDLQLAINGSFFYPFYERTPWNYYPESGDLINPLGQSIYNSFRYGKSESRWNLLCFTKFNKAQIYPLDKCPENTAWGIAGYDIIVFDGLSDITRDTPNYARTVVATNKQGDKLWLIVVDGKQPLYSEGATLKEVAEIALNLGADRAINLDGGGSTTLAVSNNNNITILNAPIHSKIPMTERPVTNHLGFFALP